MRRVREFLGLPAPLAGLENIFKQVSNDELTQEDAAQQIRDLASKRSPVWS